MVGYGLNLYSIPIHVATSEDPRLDSLRHLLRRHGRLKAPALCQALGVSQPTLSRLLTRLRPELAVGGRSSRTAYALKRSLRGLPASLPLYRITAAGKGEEVGELSPVGREGCVLRLQRPLGWPLAEDMVDGWFDGLPYFLLDARPQGFLGRNFARQVADTLQVPADPGRWSDDDVLHVLALAGEDVAGDLLIGEVAYRRCLERMAAGEEALDDEALATAYPRRAQEALAGGFAGSSAGGEFPKFTAVRHSPAGGQPVLVKFSGADATPAVARWRDLLQAEAWAAQILRTELGIPAAASRICRCEGRIFLEVERFDRVGPHGRAPVCTLAGIEAALLGLGDARWDKAATALHAAGHIDAATRQAMVTLHCFGGLIANSDMHAGNLAFAPQEGRLALAPLYDMLPMAYVPWRGGELPELAFSPPPPLPEQEGAWRLAARAALRYWQCIADSGDYGSDFRRIAQGNAAHIAHLQKIFGA